MREWRSARWWAKALTPPIVVIAVKGALRRVGLLGPEPATDPEPATREEAPPEFEYVSEGAGQSSPSALSIAVQRASSSQSTSVIATPVRPARPVRPIRCT